MGEHFRLAPTWCKHLQAGAVMLALIVQWHCALLVICYQCLQAGVVILVCISTRMVQHFTLLTKYTLPLALHSKAARWITLMMAFLGDMSVMVYVLPLPTTSSGASKAS